LNITSILRLVYCFGIDLALVHQEGRDALVRLGRILRALVRANTMKASV
jgi:hypothetical protein